MPYFSSIGEFPFCVVETTNADDVKYRPALSLPKLFEWFYRVKTWKFELAIDYHGEASITPSAQPNISAIVDGTGSGSNDAISNSLILDETYFTCKIPDMGGAFSMSSSSPNFDSDQFSPEDNYGDNPRLTQYRVDTSAVFQFNSWNPSFVSQWILRYSKITTAPTYPDTSIKKYGDYYYPFIGVSAYAQIDGNVFEEYEASPYAVIVYAKGKKIEIEFRSYDYTIPSGFSDYPISIEIDEITLPCKGCIKITETSGIDGDPISPYNLTLPDPVIRAKISPQEFWEYDPGDADDYPGKDGSGPVYDSATGEQLRNPINIVKRGDGAFYNPNYTP